MLSKSQFGKHAVRGAVGVGIASSLMAYGSVQPSDYQQPPPNPFAEYHQAVDSGERIPEFGSR